jgi:hypothetical protein
MKIVQDNLRNKAEKQKKQGKQGKYARRIKTTAILLAGLIALGTLSGCASNGSAPCSHYGAFCSKTPINGWDHNA